MKIVDARIREWMHCVRILYSWTSFWGKWAKCLARRTKTPMNTKVKLLAELSAQLIVDIR